MGKLYNDKVWELAVAKVNNSLDAAGEAEFEQIKNSEEVREALKHANQIYSSSANSFLTQQIDREKNWKYIISQTQKKIPLRIFITRVSKYAAVFLLALVLGITITKIFEKSDVELAYNKIEMAWGQMSSLTLSDGTQVWLNAGTTFEYPTSFNTKRRLVNLNGEAQFKVTHNKKAPFEVITKTGNVKVYGTTFNISSYDDDPEFVVTLIEGKVTVENSNGDYLTALNPSEQLSINKQTGEAKLRKVNTLFYSSWIDGKILLEDTKLKDLTTILKRWYNVDIQLVGEEVGNIQISGTILKGKSLDLFLKILERMYGVKYELIIKNNEKDEVIIYKNKLPMHN